MKKISLYAFFVLFCFFYNPLFAQILTWTKDDNALRYQVKVFDENNKEVKTLYTTNDSIDLGLDSGTYYYEITVFNALNKPAVTTSKYQIDVVKPVITPPPVPITVVEKQPEPIPEPAPPEWVITLRETSSMNLSYFPSFAYNNFETGAFDSFPVFLNGIGIEFDTFFSRNTKSSMGMGFLFGGRWYVANGTPRSFFQFSASLNVKWRLLLHPNIAQIVYAGLGAGLTNKLSGFQSNSSAGLAFATVGLEYRFMVQKIYFLAGIATNLSYSGNMYTEFVPRIGVGF